MVVTKIKLNGKTYRGPWSGAFADGVQLLVDAIEWAFQIDLKIYGQVVDDGILLGGARDFDKDLANVKTVEEFKEYYEELTEMEKDLDVIKKYIGEIEFSRGGSYGQLYFYTTVYTFDDRDVYRGARQAAKWLKEAELVNVNVDKPIKFSNLEE